MFVAVANFVGWLAEVHSKWKSFILRLYILLACRSCEHDVFSLHTYIISYEARTRQVNGVSTCPTQVRHRRTLNTRTTHVWHTVLRIPFKKYYFSAQTQLDNARIWPEYNLVLFFQLFDGLKINSKIKKSKFI